MLLVAAPGVAAAGEDDNPLADVPPEYEPALDAAAQEFGLSADQLQSASQEELESLLCAALDQYTVDEVVAKAEAALEELPDEDLDGLTPERRAHLTKQLPALMASLKTEVCADGGDATSDADATGGDDATSDDDADDASSDEIPVPTRIDTGGGGAQTPTVVVAGLLGVVLAAMSGVAIAGRRRG